MNLERNNKMKKKKLKKKYFNKGARATEKQILKYLNSKDFRKTIKESLCDKCPYCKRLEI